MHEKWRHIFYQKKETVLGVIYYIYSCVSVSRCLVRVNWAVQCKLVEYARAVKLECTSNIAKELNLHEFPRTISPMDRVITTIINLKCTSLARTSERVGVLATNPFCDSALHIEPNYFNWLFSVPFIFTPHRKSWATGRT